MASSAVPTVDGLGRIPQELYIVAVTLLVITWIAVFARAYVRAYMLRSVGWDDWTLIPTQICYTAQCAYLISMARMEMDPTKYNNIKSISQLVTNLVVFSGIYGLTCVLLKISLGLFFLRIIAEKWQRNVIYAGITINTIYGITYFGLCTFGCGDPSKYLIRITLNQCISIKHVVIPASYVFTGLNAAMDWTMALLPITTIWHLNMPTLTKFYAYLLMLLGAAGSIVSLIRFAFVESLEPDVMFFKNTGKLAIYSHIEPGLGIVAVCCATLRPLFRQCIEGAKSVSSTQKSHGPSGKRTSVTEASEIQLTSIRKNRRAKDGFITFDESDGMQTQWSNEHEIGVKTDFTVETRSTAAGSYDVEHGKGLLFPEPPELPEQTVDTRHF
ncbi:hypothetical protein QM012_005069 [Aureobasidium pullulans]|uniref:Rhodopsin domain-containing protein n=1 Tax=Aureobasidium pullulans TaxID=5580 RepID=A0ABR0T7M4_AURPU